MANHKSAIKKAKQDLGRRMKNRWHRGRLRTALKKYRTAIEAGELETARGMHIELMSLVDRSVKHGILHENAGRRQKSRLTVSLQRAEAA